MPFDIVPLAPAQAHAAANLILTSLIPMVDFRVIYPHGASRAAVSHDAERILYELRDANKWHLIVVDNSTSPHQAQDQVGEASPQTDKTILSYAEYNLIQNEKNANTNEIKDGSTELTPSTDANTQAFKYMFDTLETARKAVMQDASSYLYLVQVATSPAARRRGAASLLVQWGREKARKLGIPVFLITYPPRVRSLERAGWRVVKVVRFDFTPFTGAPEDVVECRAMRLDPPTKA